MTSASQPYRPAVRGLAFGLGAIGLRACTIGLGVLVTSRESLGGYDKLMVVLPVMNLLATLVALVGVGYSAIAAHRREWGVVLVLAWVSSVAAAVLNVETFTYALF